MCFAIAKDLTAMAFGLQDGTILYFKSKNLLNQVYFIDWQIRIFLIGQSKLIVIQ